MRVHTCIWNGTLSSGRIISIDFSQHRANSWSVVITYSLTNFPELMLLRCSFKERKQGVLRDSPPPTVGMGSVGTGKLVRIWLLQIGVCARVGGLKPSTISCHIYIFACIDNCLKVMFANACQRFNSECILFIAHFL